MAQPAREKENFSSACRSFSKTRADRDQAWLVELREKAAQAFQALDFPTTRDEEWKYTNVAPLLRTQFRQLFDLDLGGVAASRLPGMTFDEAAGSRLVFINGIYAPQLSSLAGLVSTSQLPEGVLVGNLGEIAAEGGSAAVGELASVAGFENEIFTALNTALLGDGAVVRIPRGQVVTAPIHLLFISTATEPIVAYPRVLIVAEAGAVATVVESYRATAPDTYFNNAVTEVVLGEGASIDHYRIQQESEQAYHIGATSVRQATGSRYNSLAVSLGGAIARHTLNVAHTGERIETTIDGLYVVTGRQHVDNHTTIDHAHPHCQSSQLYKGILDGRGRAVFNGKVLVREGALQTDARQLNKNLLLSTETTVDTKPQLEILADDVKCSHGATVGQLEDDEIFYLASRGISPERARALLTFGFAEELIGRIRIGSVREQLDRAVLDKLHQSLEVE
jgi:Fe-S cluster assembly protein SufD